MDIRSAHHLAFGPVPSRRLGRSLGINNVPTKTCDYTCVYCQVGQTTLKIAEPRPFFSPGDIREAVRARVDAVRAAGGGIDYLTFVPDGEPTLDARLGESIEALRPLGIPVAIMTNATLLSRSAVREAVAKADLVSLKVDTVDEDAWRRINLPHRDLHLDVILDGIRDFAPAYRGRLITDTMLIAGINDSERHLAGTAELLAEVDPAVAYIAVPTRPTTVAGTEGADETALTRAYGIFRSRLARVELLTGHEAGNFGHTGDARSDLLSITAVHPMREPAVRRLLEDDAATWALVEELLAEGALKTVEHAGERFFLRPVKRR